MISANRPINKNRAAVDLHPAELPGGGQLEPVGAARLLPPVAAGGGTLHGVVVE